MILVARRAGISIVVLGDLMEAFLNSSRRQKEKKANTVKKVKYKDDKGKERTREEYKKGYK